MRSWTWPLRIHVDEGAGDQVELTARGQPGRGDALAAVRAHVVPAAMTMISRATSRRVADAR